MRQLKILIALLCMIVLAIALGCSPRIAVVDEGQDLNQFPVATFDSNYSLSAQELRDSIWSSMILRGGGLVTDSTIKDFLDSMLIDTLTGMEARFVDLSEMWGTYRVWQGQVRDEINRVYWQTQLLDTLTLDTAEAMQYYHDSTHLWTIQEQVKLYHILCTAEGLLMGEDSASYKAFSGPELRMEAQDYCKRLEDLLKYGEIFQNVAFDYSHDALSRDAGGYVGWTVRGHFKDPFDSVAFNTEIGEFSEPYEDEDGWHILYIDGHMDSGPLPIDSPGVFQVVWDQYSVGKMNAARQRIIDTLGQDYELTFNPDVLDTNIYLVDDWTWAGILNGTDTIDVRAVEPLELKYTRVYGVKQADSALRKAMISEAAWPYIVAYNARQMGIDTIESVKHNAYVWYQSKAKHSLLSGRFGEVAEPTSEEIEAYYNEHLLDYYIPKPLRIKQLLTTDSAFAKFIWDQAVTGVDLEDLQAQYPEQLEFEDMGYVGDKDLPPTMFRGAYRTHGADIGDLIKFGGKWHIYKVLEQRRSKPLSEVSYNISRTLMDRQKRANLMEYRDRLYKKYGVKLPYRLAPFTLPPVIERHPQY